MTHQPHFTSIIPPEMHGGVVKITGPRSSGKTSFSFGAERPSLTAFLDYEGGKGQGFHKQLSFGVYYDMMAGTSSPPELFEKTMSVITDLPPNRFTHAIIDNGSPLELALAAGARLDLGRYCQEYGLNYKNALAGRYGGVKPIVNFFITDRICNALTGKGIKLISVIHHISARWGSAGPIPNKKRVKGADRWLQLATLSVILIGKSDFPPVPSAMVAKEQLSRVAFDQETGVYKPQVRCLPARLPRCTYAAIRQYLTNPADLNNPAPGEAIVPAEYDIFSEQLSQQQLAIMRMALEAEQRKERQTDAATLQFNDERITKARQLKERDKLSLPAIAAQLNLTVPQVVKLLGAK